MAPGTERISTTKNIDIETREYPPVKVMQSAVVGTKGVLSYRLNLEDSQKSDHVDRLRKHSMD